MTDTAIESHRPLPVASTKHGILLLIASVMPTMAIISLVPVLPLFMAEFSSTPGSQFIVPMALTIPALCVALFAPLAGWLADRTGRKNLIVVALFVYAAVGTLPLFLGDIYHILIARAGLGIAEAAIMTVATTMLGDYFEGEKRKRWISAQIAVVSLSAIFLIAVGGLLGELFGSRGPFLLYLVAFPIAIAARFVLFEPSDTGKEDKLLDAPFPYQNIIPLIAITLGAGLLFFTVMVQLGPIMELTGVISPGMIGAVGALANIGVALGSQIFRKFQTLSAPALLAGGLMLSAAGYLGTGIITNFYGSAAFAVLACVGGGMLLPNLLTWTLRLLPAEVRGRGTGLWTGTFFLAQFSAPIIAVALAQGFGGLRPVLILYAALATVGVMLALLKARKYDPPAAVSAVDDL